MASKALMIAHNNEFTKSILEEDAFYFKTKEDIKYHIDNLYKENNGDKISNNYSKIEKNFKWDLINKKYIDFLNECNRKD
jgi:hypothetical protein